MNKIRQTISLALVVALVGLGLVTAQAQRRPNRMNDRQMGELIRRVEVSTDTYRATLANALDRSRYNGTNTEDEFNRFVQNFETSTDQLRDRFDRRVSVAADVENVLRQASVINDFMQRNRLNRRAESDWTLVRTDLNALARAYNVRWDWTRVNSGTVQPTYGQPTAGSTPYRITDREVDALIRRIENGSDRFLSLIHI